MTALCTAGALTVYAFALMITIGLSGDITAFDPRYHNAGPNNAAAAHVFDHLVKQV
jgi:peptide/nickel transport system substrate-binding protein